MNVANNSKGTSETRCVTCPYLPFSTVTRSLADCDYSSRLREFLDMLPLMTFLEHGDEIVATNELARQAIGSEIVKVKDVFLGAYPLTCEKGRQCFECLLTPSMGTPMMVSGVVQSLTFAGIGDRLVLLMDPLEEGTEGAIGDCIQQDCTFLQEIFDTSQEAMVIVQDDHILRANRAFMRIFEYPIEACLGRTLQELIVPEGRMHENEMLMHTVEIEGRATIETVRRTGTGESLDVSLVVTQVRLGAGRNGHLATYRDIRHEKQAQARLQHIALHDPLTGLANRVLFLDRLNQTMARLRRRPDRNFTVVFLDLDRFKQVNDTCGHAAGDRVLLTMAERLRSCLRPQDTVARFGGDEFALLLDETGNTEETHTLLQRVQGDLLRPVDIGSDDVCISASMGVVLGSIAYIEVEDILRDADAAMYRAKNKGQGCHEIFMAEGHAVPLSASTAVPHFMPEVA